MKISLIACLVSLTLVSWGQVNMDSLWSVWNDENQTDTARLMALYDIAHSGYLITQPDSAIHFAKRLYNEANNRNQKNWMTKALVLQAKAYSKNRMHEKAIHTLEKGLTLAKKISDNREEANMYRYIGNLYLDQQQYRKASNYFLNSLALSERLDDNELMDKSLDKLGLVYREQGNHSMSIEYFSRSLKIREGRDDQNAIAKSLNNIGIVYKDQKDFEKALDYYKRSLKIKEQLMDKKGMSNTLNNLGTIAAEKGDYDLAASYFKRSYVLNEEINYLTGIATSLLNIGHIYVVQKDYENAILYLDKVALISKEQGFKHIEAVCLTVQAEVYTEQNLPLKSIEKSTKALDIFQHIGSIDGVKEVAQTLYNSYNSLNRHSKALEMYKLYIVSRDSIMSEKNQRDLIRHEYKYEYEKEALADSLEFTQKEAIKDLELEKQQANISRQRIAIGSIAIGLLLIIALAFSIYQGKKRSDKLLLNILPEETAKELKAKGKADAKQFDQVTVMFTDFKDFTQISEKLSPTELVSEIDTCFKAFDNIIGKHNIEKIKTIGDSYMCAGGLPVANATNASDVVNAALEIQRYMLQHLQERKKAGKEIFEIRIGIHSGPVVAGIVGLKKFAYDIWGDTVNIASRMESSGKAGNINISSSTYELVKDKFVFKHRGKVQAKNKGEIDMYFVEKA